MKKKVYTVRTKTYQTISGYQYILELDGVAVAGFINQHQADRFAKLVNQEHAPCHCDTAGDVGLKTRRGGP